VRWAIAVVDPPRCDIEASWVFEGGYGVSRFARGSGWRSTRLHRRRDGPQSDAVSAAITLLAAVRIAGSDVAARMASASFTPKLRVGHPLVGELRRLGVKARRQRPVGERGEERRHHLSLHVLLERLFEECRERGVLHVGIGVGEETRQDRGRRLGRDVAQHQRGCGAHIAVFMGVLRTGADDSGGTSRSASAASARTSPFSWVIWLVTELKMASPPAFPSARRPVTRAAADVAWSRRSVSAARSSFERSESPRRPVQSARAPTMSAAASLVSGVEVSLVSSPSAIDTVAGSGFCTRASRVTHDAASA